MPALPDVPNVVKCTATWGVDGDATAQTIHFFKYSGTVTNVGISDIASEVCAAFQAGFETLCTSFTGVLEGTCRDLASSMGFEETNSAPWVGTRTGDRLSPGTAAVVGHSIRRHYRGGHPRTYLPAGSGTDVASTGLWSDAFVTAVQAGWGTFVTQMLGGYDAMNLDKIVNVSYFGPPNRTITGSTGRVRTVSTVRTVPIVDDILSHSTNKKIGSQRRRNKAA